MALHVAIPAWVRSRPKTIHLHSVQKWRSGKLAESRKSGVAPWICYRKESRRSITARQEGQSKVRKIKEALPPPKPKELVMAWRMDKGRAVIGTKLRP